MSKKVYAIAFGYDKIQDQPVQNLILKSWPKAEAYIKGVKNAKYKSFRTEAEAKAYLADNMRIAQYASAEDYSKDCLLAYVDGSYSQSLKNYSYGLVCVLNQEVVYYEKGIGNNPAACSMRQIGGELLGAMKALLFAKKENYCSIAIFHDYQGTSQHATGSWKTNHSFSKVYHDWMQSFFAKNPQMKISFCKVNGHQGDEFNEIADSLAKAALKISIPAKNRERLLKHHIVWE